MYYFRFNTISGGPTNESLTGDEEVFKWYDVSTYYILVRASRLGIAKISRANATTEKGTSLPRVVRWGNLAHIITWTRGGQPGSHATLKGPPPLSSVVANLPQSPALMFIVQISPQQSKSSFLTV